MITTVVATNTLLADLPIAKKTSIKINDIKPSLRVEPLYPQSAIENQQEGSVILKFDITAKGKTDNIEIVQSFPEGVFDASAIEALAQWEYKSHLSGVGNMTGSFVQLDFRLYRREH